MLKVLMLDKDSDLHDSLPSYFHKHITTNQLDKFECHKNVNLMSFDYYDIKNTDAEPSQIIIYYDIRDVIFICENEKVYTEVENVIKAKRSETNEYIIYYFFLELIKNDTLYLEKFEEDIIAREDGLITSSIKGCAEQIVEFRRQLFIMKKYYEQLNSIFEGLVSNENALISEESLRYFRILDSRIDRLYENVRELREYVAQMREAYQSQIDIQQNSLMKAFTVVTAIFLPLTLLVGWYGMNVQIPEFEWEYGYYFVIGLSVAIALACIIIFKKKKWF